MTTIKQAKYRVKNEQGTYDVVHFETDIAMVNGLDDKVLEIETSMADRYTKAEADELFQAINGEVDAVEEIANGLNTRLTSVEGEIVGLQTGLANEIARATGVEGGLQNQIDGLNAKIEAVNHAETGILKQAKDYTDGKIADVYGTIGALEGRVAAVEGRVTGLETNVAELREEDARLAQEIKDVKDVLTGRGSDNKVFETLEEFKGAELEAKIGDLVFVVDIKKAFIFKGVDTLSIEGIPAGWVVFDEITTELDLVNYVKKEELATVQSVVAEHGGRLTAVEGTVADHTGRIDALEVANGQVYTKEQVDQLVDEAVTAQMPVCSNIQPDGAHKVGHVWIELA